MVLACPKGVARVTVEMPVHEVDLARFEAANPAGYARARAHDLVLETYRHGLVTRQITLASIAERLRTKPATLASVLAAPEAWTGAIVRDLLNAMGRGVPADMDRTIALLD